MFADEGAATVFILCRRFDADQFFPNQVIPSNNRIEFADMDARSVMEQRVQSMVCCISLVQQVMQQQPEYLQNSYPLVAYTPSEAVRKVWAKLVIIPELLGKYLLKSNMGPSKQSISQEGGPIDDEMAEDSVETKAVSGNVKSKPNMLKLVKEEIEVLVREEPKSLAAIRQLCFNVRDKISKISHLSTEKARLKQLCDVLVLWAYTSNFSYAQVSFCILPHSYHSLIFPPPSTLLGLSASGVCANSGRCQRIRHKYSAI